ncbi:MAG: ATP synthase subunit C [Candidatus Fimenecus sp.]
MTALFYILLILAPVALIYSAFTVIKARSQGKSIKKSVRMNLLVFAALIVMISLMSVSVFAADNGETAQTEQTQTAEAADSGASKGMGLLAAGLVTGLAGIGGGIAVAAGAPAAIAATAEDPKSFGKSIIFVALGESIALYGVVISILILQKV